MGFTLTVKLTARICTNDYPYFFGFCHAHFCTNDYPYYFCFLSCTCLCEWLSILFLFFVMHISVRMTNHIIIGSRHAHVCTNDYPYSFWFSPCTCLYKWLSFQCVSVKQEYLHVSLLLSMGYSPCARVIPLAVTGCVFALPRAPAHAHYFAWYLMVTVNIRTLESIFPVFLAGSLVWWDSP